MITRLKAVPDWNAKAYQQFSKLRQRPVNELLDRVHLQNPKRIIDLGCGTGIATRLLAERWPRAQVLGIDSSAQMLDEARGLPINASWQQCDLLDWQPEQPVDLLFAAAVLHFIHGHETLLPNLLGQLNAGGCLAAHMPDWRDALWYRLMLETLDDGGVGGTPLGTPELRQRIFDPFFTTKPVGSGTGLGLSISYSIINKHHGRIDLDSTPGVGSRFRVVLPVKQPR